MTGKYVDHAPEGIKWVRFWDFAATAKVAGNDPDWTVGLKMGELDGRFYVADVDRSRMDPGDTQRRVREVADRDGREVAIWMEQERGSAGKHVVASFGTSLPGYEVHGDPPTGDKVTRFRPFSAAAKLGLVYVMRGDWVSSWIKELQGFPTGSYKDQADATSGAHKALAVPEEDKPEPFAFSILG